MLIAGAASVRDPEFVHAYCGPLARGYTGDMRITGDDLTMILALIGTFITIWRGVREEAGHLLKGFKKMAFADLSFARAVNT
jgi:hypothetical protein